MRLTELFLAATAIAASTSALGCIAYEHTTDAEVRDPRRVWVESTSLARERFEPATIGEPSPMPGTKATVEREASGAIEVDGRTAVNASGTIRLLPRTLAPVQIEGDVVRIPVCFRRSGCTPGLRLVTTLDNVRLLRERDEPIWFIGIQELLLGTIGIVGSRIAWDPHTSGGPLLLTLGIGFTLSAGLQFFAPAKNESSVVP